MSILNVYASTIVRERLELWAKLLSSLETDCKWILCGDWNFVEHRADKFTMCGKIISPAEQHAFATLIGALNLEEIFPRHNAIKFSWDNRQREGMRILARLDRFYSFKADGKTPSPIAEYFIKGDCTFSDHLPVWGKVLLRTPL